MRSGAIFALSPLVVSTGPAPGATDDRSWRARVWAKEHGHERERGSEGEEVKKGGKRGVG